MKILMLTDSLGIGGAETHIETLALELIALGHEVVIAAADGEIAQRLIKKGVKILPLPEIRPNPVGHGALDGPTPRENRPISVGDSALDVPTSTEKHPNPVGDGALDVPNSNSTSSTLHPSAVEISPAPAPKNHGNSGAPLTHPPHPPRSAGNSSTRVHRPTPTIARFWSARRQIQKYIDLEKPDIVHAHTRRTAFWAKFACKRRKIPLVTTAHALFSMKFPKNKLSCWGDGVIAVSSDIKNHLARHGVPQNRIEIVENGVKIPPPPEIRPNIVEGGSLNVGSETLVPTTFCSTSLNGEGRSWEGALTLSYDVPTSTENRPNSVGDGALDVPTSTENRPNSVGDGALDVPTPTENRPNSVGHGALNVPCINSTSSTLHPSAVEISPSPTHPTTNSERPPHSAGNSSTRVHRPTPTVSFYTTKIVFVSRLDADCSLGAHLLCEIAPKLHQKLPDLEIIIVGGGDDFLKIVQKSAEINAKINHKLINAVGNVANPSVFFSKSTLFVGVSRAAIEAMAHGLPVILLGNEGYLGLLNEKNLQLAQDTNFTCRGAKNATSDSLFCEIMRFFALSDHQKSHLSELSRATVVANYSAEKMARRTIAIYEKALYPTPVAQNGKKGAKELLKIAICGYYGHGNFGDESILRVVSRHVARKYPSAKFHVVKSSAPIFCTVRMLHKTDIFIFGGGSLLQNSTSNASLLYYLTIIFLASLLSRRKIMLANGIGPIITGKLTRPIVNFVLSRAINCFDFISVRDTDSQKILQSLLPKRKINLVPDPATIDFTKLNQQLINVEKTTQKQEYFVFCPHFCSLEKAKIDLKTLANSLKEVSKIQGASAKIVVLNEEEDLFCAKALQGLIGDAEILVPSTSEDVADLFSGAKFVISSRYHGVLLAFALGALTVALSGDPKIHGACLDFSSTPPFPVEKLGESTLLCEYIDRLLGDNQKSVAKTLDLMKKFSENAEIALENLI